MGPAPSTGGRMKRLFPRAFRHLPENPLKGVPPPSRSDGSHPMSLSPPLSTATRTEGDPSLLPGTQAFRLSSPFRPANLLGEEDPSHLFPSHPSWFRWLSSRFAPGKVTYLTGDEDLVEGFLPMVLTGAALQGATLSLRVGASRFSPYPLGSLARLWGCPPARVLERIRLARAFTAYQMVTLSERWLDHLASGLLPGLLGILDPFGLFSDPAVPPEEGDQLLRHVLEMGVRTARSVSRPLLLTGGEGGPAPGIRPALHDVLEVRRARGGDETWVGSRTLGTSLAIPARPGWTPSLESFDEAFRDLTLPVVPGHDHWPG